MCNMGTDSADGMLQLAAEAFQSKNFELASDIYECQLLHLSDPASQLELMVKRADALAFGGKVSEAFEMYRKASKIERLRPIHLENLIEYLIGSIKTKEDTDGQNQQQCDATECGGYDAFSCRICYGFLFQPVTLPCGHCFCKKCLDREKSPVCCKECNDSSKLTDVNSYRVNVVLNNLLSKWFPIQLRAAQLRREGNCLYAEKRMEAGLEKYNQAIQIAPRDHVLYSNRSQINVSLKRHQDALRDAEMACKLMPRWSKGHIKNAQALVTLGKTEEALREYLVCISLDPESKLARTEAHKLLCDLLVPVMDHVHDKTPDCSSLLSSRTRIKGSVVHPPTSGCLTAPSSWSYETTGVKLTVTDVRLHGLLSQDRKTVITSRESSGEKPSVPRPHGEPKEPTRPCEKTECGKVKGDEQEGMNSVCHATVVDRSLFLKRKRSAEDDSAADGVKRPKSEGSQTEGTTCWSAVVGDVIDPTDLECSLCMRLFYEPVTTPCGHTFCLKCLERCLDHNPRCPLCKEELSEYLAQRQYCKTILMENLICKYLPAELLDRQMVNQEEMAELSNLNKNVPIFVCTMAFPTVPCPLHIFEPCYRLMIRRCMETGTKQFGMCLGDSHKGFMDYGCLLEIRNVEFFADGRSVVDCIGRRRFKVKQHSQRDGYNTADIEYLEDVKAEGPEEQELRCLHDEVYDQALVWVDSLRAEQKERIVGHFGSMPEKDSQPQASPNGPSWCWWLLAVLPLESRAQLPFLALTSLKERLSGIRRVLLFMSRNRQR